MLEESNSEAAMSESCWSKYDKIAEELFGNYASYSIVEQSDDHVVIDAYLPYKQWQYKELHFPHQIVISHPESYIYHTGMLMPIAVMNDGIRLRWKAVMFLDLGVQTRGEGRTARIKSDRGWEMQVFGYTFGGDRAWCEWDNGRRCGCFKIDELDMIDPL